MRSFLIITISMFCVLHAYAQKPDLSIDKVAYLDSAGVKIVDSVTITICFKSLKEYQVVFIKLDGFDISGKTISNTIGGHILYYDIYNHKIDSCLISSFNEDNLKIFFIQDPFVAIVSKNSIEISMSLKPYLFSTIEELILIIDFCNISEKEEYKYEW